MMQLIFTWSLIQVLVLAKYASNVQFYFNTSKKKSRGISKLCSVIVDCGRDIRLQFPLRDISTLFFVKTHAKAFDK